MTMARMLERLMMVVMTVMVTVTVTVDDRRRKADQPHAVADQITNSK